MEKKDWDRAGYRHVFIRRAWIIGSTNAVYVPIAKSASTTMRHVLPDDFIAELRRSERYQDFKKGYSGDINLDDDDMLIHFYTPRGVSSVFDSMATLDELVSGSRRFFTVVRHPLKRFLSAWRDKIVSSGNTSLKYALQRFYNREEGASFSIDDLIVYASEAPLQNMDIHILPQWSCCGAGRIPFEMIGKVENLRQDVEAFEEAGLIPKGSVDHLGISNASGNSAAGSAGFDSLTQAQMSTLTAIYERDFEMFDY